jgi:hypothetical protein
VAVVKWSWGLGALARSSVKLAETIAM